MRQQYRSHTDSVNGMMWQPFTNFFVSGSADKTVSIWDMRTGLTVQTFYGHMNAINDTVFSIGGQYVASADADGIVKITGKSLPVSSIRVKKFLGITQFGSSVHQTGFVPPVKLEDAIEKTLRYEFIDDNSDKPVFLTEQ